MNIPKEYLINFDELKVGQRVWSATSGYVLIKSTNENENYPILVVDQSGIEYRFTKSGHGLAYDLLPTLFLDCPYQEEERVVEVKKDENDTWTQAKLIAISNGKFVCKIDINFAGTMMHQISEYNFMREIEPVKEVVLTREQIAEKFGCRVEELKIDE